jgi:hypothetical protein
VEFEPIIPVFKRAKAFCASESTATVIGIMHNYGEEQKFVNVTGLPHTQNAATPGMTAMYVGALINHRPTHYHNHVFLEHKNKPNYHQHTKSIKNTQK